MERLRPSMGRDLSPKQLDTLQKVLKHIASQPWFDNREHCRQALAERLALLIHIGIESAAHLQIIAVSWSVDDFNRAKSKTDRAVPKSMGQIMQLRDYQ
ncbi:hypothetical protein [Rhizobium sp. SYY.PMSO]|uniref:hypothetical protein n=1 Tax=Rhizobium sp. SYY.PMSO TaxID=3382192 RepID=UPI0039902A83